MSFESNGRERLIEVKTTRFGMQTPFYASSGEVEFSQDRKEDYHLYRLFSFLKQPQLFVLDGSLRISEKRSYAHRGTPAAQISEFGT
jgi:hypothetical protein